MNNKQYSHIALYFLVEDLTNPGIVISRLSSGISHLGISDITNILHLIPISRSEKINKVYQNVLSSLPGTKTRFFDDTFKGDRFMAGQALAKHLAEDVENSLAVFLDLDKSEMFQNDEKILRKYGVEILKIK